MVQVAKKTINAALKDKASITLYFPYHQQIPWKDPTNDVAKYLQLDNMSVLCLLP